MQHSQDNYSPEEVQKFDQLASRFWDQNSEFKTLHQVNPLRLEFIQEYLNKFNSKDNLKNQALTGLDIGCGGGILTEALAKKGLNMTGIDLAPSVIKIAKLHLLETNLNQDQNSQLNINYQQISAEDFLENNKNIYFDFITCMEMLEHVPNPESIIKTASDLLKPNGLIFFSTLNRNLRSFLEAIIGAEYILKILPKGTHTYEKFIKPEELVSMARKFGLKPLEAREIKYDLFKKSFSLNTPKNKIRTNYMICFEKI